MNPTKNKIVRSLCWFAESTDPQIIHGLGQIESVLTGHGYEVQSRRVCFKQTSIEELESWSSPGDLYLGMGTLSPEEAQTQLGDFLRASRVSFNLDASAAVGPAEVEVLQRIIRESPARTFLFAYTFHNRPSSPFFPSAAFDRPGFSLGLQSTDLAENCTTLGEWMDAMREVWREMVGILDEHPGFLGIDSSVAPLFRGKSSLVHFVKRLCGSFSSAVTTDLFLKLTRFLEEENPRPVGLCGLMLPCLEDFELADEYEAGEFTVERNLFLSLHSGLGVDTYPVGIDEDPDRILEVLRLIRGLSEKHAKPLSARFVSDGKARIGDMTDFGNPYLKDVRIRPL
ncbi:MAG: DUF711 family protein [Deltaproteobacteria bacterium]|nr:DUF711 family protein [Deltaproteobacteria bacterium]